MVFGLDLSGRMAVVTGAGGILCGMFARTLAQAGASVALLDINLEAAERTAREQYWADLLWMVYWSHLEG